MGFPTSGTYYKSNMQNRSVRTVANEYRMDVVARCSRLRILYTKAPMVSKFNYFVR